MCIDSCATATLNYMQVKFVLLGARPPDSKLVEEKEKTCVSIYLSIYL